MTKEISKKMYMIASQVNYLNAAGEVKAYTGHQKGYAKIVAINSGCSVFAQHTLTNKLTIDLLVTKPAALKWPLRRDLAVTTFETFAKDNGYNLSKGSWQHSVTATDIRQRHTFDISNESFQTISALIERLKLSFGELKQT